MRMRSSCSTIKRSLDIDKICSGDLLAWRGNKQSSISNWLIRTVASLTGSPYGHVGVAWRYGDAPYEVLVFEATLPFIKISPLTISDDVYVVPMGMEDAWTRNHTKWLLDKVGMTYSLMDALRAFLGRRLDADDNRWQCAEYCHWFYADHGIELTHDFTPGGLVRAALSHSNSTLCRLN